MQLCGKHASEIEAVFSVWSMPRSCLEDNWRYSGTEGSIVGVNQRATEAEESPLLRFVIRKRLVRAQHRNSHCGERLPSKD
jgi:hypothetical protein